MILKLNIYKSNKKNNSIMKYIKTYENFNFQSTNEEFLFGGKLKKAIEDARRISNDVISNMSEEEAAEAMSFMEEKGLTKELAEETANKLNLNKSSEEAAETVAQAVPEIAGEEQKMEESVKNVIVDRLIRFVGNPLISGFLVWVSSIVLRSTAVGWSTQPEWIQKIHDALATYGLQGPVSLLVWLLTFVFCILTIAKMFHGRNLAN
jgi:hypothetical protein